MSPPRGSRPTLFPAIPTDAFTRDELKEVMEGIYGRGDRIMRVVVLLHLVVALLLAFHYSTWFATLTVGPAAAAMFFISAAFLPRSFFTRCVAGVSLQTFVALHIFQLHGLAEMHFFFFTAFTVMILYQDWRSMWLGTVLIIGQHTLFAVLHNSGVQLFFLRIRTSA